MKPFIGIFGITLPTYGVMVSAGFVAALAFVFAVCMRRRFEVHKYIITVCLAVLAGLFGAKLLSIFTLYSPRRIAQLLLSDPLRLVTDSGLVFYGGVISGIPAAYLAAKLLKTKISECEAALVPAIPLGHAFGRLGCFFAGCCYGFECKNFGVVYVDPECFAPTGIRLFPIQLFEAAFDIFLFALLVFLIFRKNREYLALPIYFASYSLWRFLAEFLRGDEIRGKLGFFSVSQWISLAFFCAAIILFVLRTKKQKHN
ncbi:MAG: prolipoprotein diacylglyceryl transferase [Ruminococcaceae bacterium]|nr:prolipoprotein diacylglyceryl transferase [Oscillospiraceae bacterium]